jgi:AcrR family transcriptional regulator
MAVTAEALGRRERKKRDTRKALASAAVRLAAERGPDQVTIEDIAEAADVSVRTFFNYFSSKEEAIVGADPEGHVILAERLLARPPSEAPLTALRNMFVDTFDGADRTWADDRVLRQRLVREHPSLLPRHLEAHFELEKVLVHAMAERLGVDPENFELAVLVTSGVNAMRLALWWWENHGRADDLTTLLGDGFDVLERRP